MPADQPHMKEPVKIKMYGLFWITKKTYGIIASISYLLLLITISVIYYLYKTDYFDSSSIDPKILNHKLVIYASNNIDLIISIILLLVLFETLFVLRRFRKAELERNPEN